MARVQHRTDAAPAADDEPATVQLSDPPLDSTLAPDGELARQCPSYVELVTRALALRAGEGFADVRMPAHMPS